MRKHFILIPAILMSVFTFAQTTFTQVTTGDLVNDGGWNYGMCWADFNTDGYPDLFVANNDGDNGKLNFLYLNNGDGTFERVTDGQVVSNGGSSYACCAADINWDFYPDLFVANHNENNFLYLGNGDGTFEKVTTGPVVSNGGKSVGCAFADYDQDGWLDLFVVNRDQPNFLYHGTGNGEFTKITSGVLVSESANSSGCAWGDYDNDGFPDLYVANSGTLSHLYHNEGGTFSMVDQAPFNADISSCSGASWGDCDNDGDLDLFVSTGQLGTYVNWFYINNGNGTFTKVTDSPLVNEANWASGSAWGDYDKDGDLDLAVGGYDGNNMLFENDGTGVFTKLSNNAFINDASYTEGLAWADVDIDGDLDIFTAKNNYFGGNNSFFLNDGNENNWLRVTLDPMLNLSANNGDAIGAIIIAWATISGQEVMQYREISSQTGGGQAGQNEIPQFFGLGDAATVDSMHVFFAGDTFKAYDVEVNQNYVFDIGTAAVQEVSGTDAFNIYPNPAGDYIWIASNTIIAQGLIQLVSIEGKILIQKEIPDFPKTESMKIDLAGAGVTLQPGIYLLKLTNRSKSFTQKVMIE
ncbi:MAG: VCBS repeat-containing protein [Bacteroidetes bacterium]|nr:VCBS repeat-containing protein [Bacteroidota bacterium]